MVQMRTAPHFGRIARLLPVLLCLSFVAASAHQAFPPSSSLDRAYQFLDARMDRYESGSSLRVVQSFVRTPTFSDGDVSYTYDDTVMILALLARGEREDLRRARVLGDSLLYAQKNDPYADGRIRDGYHARRFINSDGSPNIAISDGDGGSDNGNMAWTAMAFVQLYNATGRNRYLAGAQAIAKFIQANAWDTRGAGGFTGGITQRQTKIKYKSTEHNIDLYALFRMLYQATQNETWNSDAGHALRFVKAMWDAKRGRFWIGTGDDGITVNTSDPTPEDVQTWSYLSTGLARYQGSIDWALRHLSATGGVFAGLSFQVKDRSGVWFEGSAHAAAALEARNLANDTRKAARLLKDIEIGQMNAPNADDLGIDAASKDGLKTGDGGDKYYASLHIGATAWYCLAGQSANPFRFLTPIH
jgi:uncharacterized protein YyaL (SSP411 family)